MTDPVTPPAAPVIAPVTHPVTPPAPVAPIVSEPQMFSREYVQELREENKTWRQKAQGHESEAQRQKDAAAAAKAASDAAVAAANADAQGRILRAELKAHAIRAGMVDLDGLKLLDLSTVTLNAAGEIDGADALFETAKAAKPWLFSAPTAPSTTPPATTSSIATPPPQTTPAEKPASEWTAAERRAWEIKHGLRSR